MPEGAPGRAARTAAHDVGVVMHALNAHVCVFALHTVLHMPQLFMSRVVSVHAIEQYVRPVAQQLPLEQDCPPVHRAPHAPQFAESFCVFAQ